MRDDDETTNKREGRASTGSARAEGEATPGDSGESGQPHPQPLSQAGGEIGEPASPAGGDVARVHPNKHRELQVARTGGRKLFNRARKRTFLQWFAATSNLGWAAEKAGVTRQTVSKHLQSDAEFRSGYDEALQVSLLRLKAKTMETRKPEAPLSFEGEIDAPDLDMPIDQALAVIREQEREVRVGRRRGAMPRVASNKELLGALAKRVKVLAGRVKRRGGGE